MGHLTDGLHIEESVVSELSTPSPTGGDQKVETPAPEVVDAEALEGPKIVREQSAISEHDEVGEAEPTGESDPAAEQKTEALEQEGSVTEPPPATEVKKKSGVQKRIAELVRQREEKAREAERERQAREKLEQRLETLEGRLLDSIPGTTTKKEADGSPQKPAIPVEEDFDDYSEYAQAMAKYTSSLSEYVDQLSEWKISQRFQEKEREAELARDKEAQDEKQRILQTNLDLGRKKYDDFEDVVRGNPALSEEMIEITLGSEHCSDLLYYLGENPEESIEIYKMAPTAAALAIGRIEAKLSGLPSPQKKTTSAPPPPPTVGSHEVVSRNPSGMTNDEYRKWRMEEGT